MAYTTFAILASGVILTIILLPANTYDATTQGEETLVTQASFATNSILQDKDRVHNIALERAIAEAKSQTLVLQEPLENPEEAVSEIKLEGTYQGQELEFMENASFRGWFERVEQATANAGYHTEQEVQNIEYTEEPENFAITAEMTSQLKLNDPNINAWFNRTQTYESTAQFTGLEDPMIRLQTSDVYGHIITQCTFEEPATIITDNLEDDSDSIVHGEANINPEITDPEEHEGEILVVTGNIEEEYDEDETQEFNAVITQEGDPSEYNTHYAATPDTNQFENEMSVTLTDEEEIWNTRFREMIQQECYISFDNESELDSELTGPTMFERMQNTLESENPGGMLSLVDKQDDFAGPLNNDESNIAFINFQENTENYGENQEIKGITTLDEGEQRTDFLLNQEHIEHWEIDGLVVE